MFDATEFFFGDTERAAEVVGLLGSFALAPYSLPADLLATNAPLSMTATTTSRRMLNFARQRTAAASPPLLTLGVGGSAACAAALERVGITQQSLFDSPRYLVELHLPNLEKAAALVLPTDKQALSGGGGSSSRPAPPPTVPCVEVGRGKTAPPPGTR